MNLVGRVDKAVSADDDYLQGVQIIIGPTANVLELLSPVHQLVCVCACVRACVSVLCLFVCLRVCTRACV